MTNKEQIIEILKQQRGHYINGVHLRGELSALEFRKLIKELRGEGYAIIANSRGYKLISPNATQEELKELRDYITSRNKELRSEAIIINKMLSFYYENNQDKQQIKLF